MLLGLVADVHNDADGLARALESFRNRKVDKVVSLGDVCDAFSPAAGAAEVAALLDECRAEGVWGNHDFNLCREVSDFTRGRYPAPLFDTMGRMQPRLVIGDCHFSHREASADPLDAAQLWDLDDNPPVLAEKAALAFAANEHRVQFVGHYHGWWAATPDSKVEWRGERPLQLDPERRYWVVVNAVCCGWCATLNIEKGLLEPIHCGRSNG